MLADVVGIGVRLVVIEDIVLQSIIRTGQTFLLRDVFRRQEIELSEKLSAFNAEVWEKINAHYAESKKKGGFDTPMLVRYAVKLYDGSYIYQSVPILLGAGFMGDYVKMTGYQYHVNTGNIETTKYTSSYVITYGGSYYPYAYLEKWEYEGWEDIITSVDIFLSTNIYYPKISASFASIEQTYQTTIGRTTETQFNILFDGQHEGDEKESDIKAEILSKGNFYKIAHFGLKELSKLTTENGYKLWAERDLLEQTTLVLQEGLPDDETAGRQSLFNKMLQYNNRIIGNVGRQKLSSGYYHFPADSACYTSGGGLYSTRPLTMNIKYYIRCKSGKTYTVLGRNPSGGYDINQGYSVVVGTEGGKITMYPQIYGYLVHPNPDCYQVDILYGDEVAQFKMEPHPSLNCSYCYLGFSKTLVNAMFEQLVFVTSQEKFLVEDFSASVEDILYQSAVSNPFYYPVSGKLKFTGRINGIATTTKALSTGQFGQFPLYVFTGDGIFAMTTNSDGTFSTFSPLSREVALDGKVFPIDQAIVFITEKGVMMLQGSDITELSPNMNGKHWVIEDDAKDIISSKTQYGNLLEPLVDNTPFMAFMKQATCCYDYTGKRLVFFNDSCNYQYVYMLPTGTWHKCRQNAALPYHFDSALSCHLACGDSHF